MGRRRLPCHDPAHRQTRGNKRILQRPFARACDRLLHQRAEGVDNQGTGCWFGMSHIIVVFNSISSLKRLAESPLQIKTTQDISTFIRDLKELWLFGGLDTLADPADEAAHRTKAIEVAALLETLAKRPSAALQSTSNNGSVNGTQTATKAEASTQPQAQATNMATEP